MTNKIETYKLDNGYSLNLYDWDEMDGKFYIGINSPNKEAGFVTYDFHDNPFDAIFTFMDLGLITPLYNSMSQYGYPIDVFDETLPAPKPTKDVIEGIRQNRHKIRLDYWENIKQGDKGLFNHNMDGDPYNGYRTIAGDFVSKLSPKEFKKLLANILVNVLWDRYQSK